MPKKIRDAVTSLEETSIENALKHKSDIYFDDEELDPMQIGFINDLEFITGYGRGYWAGVDEEFTLVRQRSTKLYYWLYTDYRTCKAYKVSRSEAEHLIFVKEIKDQRSYFTTLLVRAAPVELIPGDTGGFCVDVWSKLAIFNGELRMDFKRFVANLTAIEKKKERITAIDYFKNTPNLISIEVISNRVIATFRTGEKFEIKDVN